MSPLSADKSLIKRLNNVVLPLPLSPTIPTLSLSEIEKVTFSNIFSLKNDLVKPLTLKTIIKHLFRK